MQAHASLGIIANSAARPVVPLLALGLGLRIPHCCVLPTLLLHPLVIKGCCHRRLRCLLARSSTRRRCAAALRHHPTALVPLPAGAELHCPCHAHWPLPPLRLRLLSSGGWCGPRLPHIVLLPSQLAHASAHHQRLIQHCSRGRRDGKMSDA